MQKVNKMKNTEKLDGSNSNKSESTTQPGINPAEPSSPLKTHGKLEDVFILKSAEYPLEQHECNTFLPPMLPDQFRRLLEEIRRDGLRVPMVLCEGKILDGWQRYQICRQLKIQPRFEEFTGKRPLLQCWTLNIARRHLEKSQLAVLANEMGSRLLRQFTATKEEATKSGQAESDKTVTATPANEVGDSEGEEKKRTKPKRGRTRSLVSEFLNVSEGYIQRAKDLKEAAPDLYEKVGMGTLTLSGAVGQLSRRQQAEGVLRATEKERPSDKLQIKGWVIKICNLLTTTQHEEEAYETLEPVLAWARDYEKRQQAVKERREKDDLWMRNIGTKFPIQKAA